MKSLILGLIGAFVTLYTFLIGIDMMLMQTSKNEMDRQVSRVVKQALEEGYSAGEEEIVLQLITQELRSIISKGEDVHVEIQAIDLQKGLLSVKVSKQVKLMNGKVRELVVEKTAIIERSMWDKAYLEVD